MAPTCKSFHFRNAAGVQIDHRLESKDEFASFECPAQIGHEIRALSRPSVHRRLEQDVPRFPSRLGPVHRQVCVVQQVGGGDGPMRFDNDEPDTGCDHHVLAIDGEGGLQGRRHRGSEPLGLMCVRQPVEQDGELVPPEPGHGIAWPDRVLQAVRYRDEEAITGSVAEPVVDQLEAIEVEEEDPYRLAQSPRPRQRLLEAVEQARPIGQTGQWVVVGLMNELRLRLPTETNVMCQGVVDAARRKLHEGHHPDMGIRYAGHQDPQPHLREMRQPLDPIVRDQRPPP